jgi:hypothetical protein
MKSLESNNILDDVDEKKNNVPNENMLNQPYNIMHKISSDFDLADDTIKKINSITINANSITGVGINPKMFER